MATLEEVAAEVTNIRNEMNAMQTALLITQSMIKKQTDREAAEDEDGEEKITLKYISFKIKECQHLTPTQWSGEKDSPFADLSHDVITYMTSIYKHKAASITEVLKEDRYEVDEEIAKDPILTNMNNHLYAVLSKTMHGEPKKIIRNAKRDGLAAWHRLHESYDPRTTTDSSVSIQKIIHPVKGKDATTTKIALENFETDVREHEAKFEEVQESLKIAGLKNLVPEAWFEQHFKGAKFESYAAAKAKLLNIANDRRVPRTKVSPGNEMNMNYWGYEEQGDEGILGYYGSTPYGKGSYKGYGKGGYGGKGDFGGKGKSKGGGKDSKGGGYGGKGWQGDGGKGWYGDGGKGKGWEKGGGKGMTDKDCYKCGQKGHIARYCPKGKGGVNSFEAEEAEYEEEESEGSEVPQPEWLG